MKKSMTSKLIKIGGIATDKEMPIALIGIAGISKSPRYEIEKCSKEFFNPIALDMLNAVTHVAHRQWSKNKAINKWNEMTEDEQISLDIFEDFVREWPYTFDTVFIKESEIRNILGKNYNSDFIYKHMMNIGFLAIHGKLPVFWKNGKWDSRDIAGGIALVECVGEKDKWNDYREFHEKGRYKGAEKRIYVVRFNAGWGHNFALNILNNRIRVFPKLTYDELSYNARQLCRVIFGRAGKKGSFTLPQMRIMFGWKKEYQTSKQIIAIDKIFEDLKKKKAVKFNTAGKRELKKWNWERRDKFLYGE
ncbi:hypothetical protein ACFLQZ_02875 [Acidobacteriota bacterium]